MQIRVPRPLLIVFKHSFTLMHQSMSAVCLLRSARSAHEGALSAEVSGVREGGIETKRKRINAECRMKKTPHALYKGSLNAGGYASKIGEQGTGRGRIIHKTIRTVERPGRAEQRIGRR